MNQNARGVGGVEFFQSVTKVKVNFMCKTNVGSEAGKGQSPSCESGLSGPPLLAAATAAACQAPLTFRKGERPLFNNLIRLVDACSGEHYLIKFKYICILPL